MKTSKFNVGDVVFFRNSNSVVQTKVEYIVYSIYGGVDYYVVGFHDSISESDLFSNFNETLIHESCQKKTA